MRSRTCVHGIRDPPSAEALNMGCHALDLASWMYQCTLAFRCVPLGGDRKASGLVLSFRIAACSRGLACSHSVPSAEGAEASLPLGALIGVAAGLVLVVLFVALWLRRAQRDFGQRSGERACPA